MQCWPCSCSVTTAHQRLFGTSVSVWLQKTRLTLWRNLRPLTECQLLLHNGASWKASVCDCWVCEAALFWWIISSWELLVIYTKHWWGKKIAVKEKQHPGRGSCLLVTDYLTVGKPDFFLFFHLLEQLSAVHLHAVGQITSIKLETVMFQLPFSTFFPPVKLLCVEFEIYLHFNLSSL